MIPKSRRVPRKLFKKLLESRAYFNSDHFTLRVAPANEFRVAVSVSKKISKKAVIRNKIRRRVYSALRDAIPIFPSRLSLLIVKPGVEKIKGENLKQELVELLKKR